MKQTIELITKGFEQGSVLTPEFKQFARIFFKELKHDINNAMGSNKIIDFKGNVGHFFVSGFFKMGNGEIYYFCYHNYDKRVMIREAESFKDYTLGSNNFFSFENFGQEFVNKFYPL